MIAYKETLRNFYSHIEQNVIAEKVMEKLGKVGKVNKEHSEIRFQLLLIL